MRFEQRCSPPTKAMTSLFALCADITLTNIYRANSSVLGATLCYAACSILILTWTLCVSTETWCMHRLCIAGVLWRLRNTCVCKRVRNRNHNFWPGLLVEISQGCFAMALQSSLDPMFTNGMFKTMPARFLSADWCSPEFLFLNYLQGQIARIPTTPAMFRHRNPLAWCSAIFSFPTLMCVFCF